MLPGNEVCPPTDEPSPVPEPPTPECPDAGPELCDEEQPHQKRYLQIQMMIPMVTVMIMGMEMMGQMETETTPEMVKIFRLRH